MAQMSKTRYWNTWNAQSPAIMEFIPSKFCIWPGAYSTKADSYTNFPFTKQMRLMEHHPEGKYVRLEMEHSGTRLEMEYYKVDDWTVLGRIRCLEHGEWALRFCPTVSFGFLQTGNSQWKMLNTPQIKKSAYGMHACLRSYHFAVAFEAKPVRDCLATDPDRVGNDMVRNGYYTPCGDDEGPSWYTASFNLEATREICFAVSVSNSEDVSRANAQNALELFKNPDALENMRRDAFSGLLVQREGEFPEMAEAVRDIMAWNTLSDDITERWFIWITRFWNKKFGGWYVWMDDPYYHALTAAVAGDWQAARMSIKATIDNNVPEGNFACLMGELTEWVDRSQPPIGSFLVLRYYLLTGDKALLEEVYPALEAAHFWWYDYRDGNKNGVLEYGSSRVGNGHFGQSRLAAMDESSMDNSPMFDLAEYNPETCTMDMEDVALNSLLVLDGESLIQIARELNDPDTAERILPKIERLRKLADEQLWNPEWNIYANRHWEKGFADPSPTSFYPLLAGMPDNRRAGQLLSHMFDEEEFWTPAPFPSIWKKSSAFQDNVYWRGRMWPPLNFMVYNGLKRYGFDQEATRLVRRCAEVFSPRWKEERASFENYNTMTGQGSDSVDTDPMLGWGALLPLMWILDHIDVDPWNGFHFGSTDGGDIVLDNIKMHNGTYGMSCLKGLTELRKDSVVIFRSNAVGRFRGFLWEEHYIRVEVPAQSQTTYVEFPGTPGFSAKCNNDAAVLEGNRISLPQGKACIVELWR